MAYALVGSLGTRLDATLGTASPTFGQATTQGNLLIAWVLNENINVTPTGTSTPGWASATTGGGSLGWSAEVWYRPNCGTGETAPTFTFAASGSLHVMLGEFSGGAVSSPVDKVGTAGAGASPRTVTASGADVAAGELFITVDGWAITKAATITTTDSYNNGATPSGNNNNDAVSGLTHLRMAYGITTGNSAADQNQPTNSSMNIDTTAGGFCIASFKLPSAGTTYTKAGFATENRVA